MGEGEGWTDRKDQWSAEIEAAFPTRSGSHAEFQIAMEMIGNRHSKMGLVSLVNWLLVRLKRQEAELAELRKRKVA